MTLTESRQRLTKQQVESAVRLSHDRPHVLPGTRAILNDAARCSWHAQVTAEMRRVGISTQAEVDAFCDLAGVAD